MSSQQADVIDLAENVIPAGLSNPAHQGGQWLSTGDVVIIIAGITGFIRFEDLAGQWFESTPFYQELNQSPSGSGSSLFRCSAEDIF